MKSEDAQVISTKQVGSKTVNEPLLTLINKNLLEEKDIRWQELWDTLDKQLIKDKKAHAYFLDYIPPHKNIGLLVAKLYHDDGDQKP
jgi:AAA15 family ATPase/GTPase